MGNPGAFPTAIIPYPGGASSSGNPGTCTCYPTKHECKPKFLAALLTNNGLRTQYTYHGHGCSSWTSSRCIFPRTPAYVKPNPRLKGEMDQGVRDLIARTLGEFGFTPKGRARSFQKPYPKYFDMIPYARDFWVLDLAKFTSDDAKTTYEHIGQFLAQVNDMGITDIHKIRMFPLSLTGTTFNWFTSLPLNSIDSWVTLEQKFHDYFYNGEVEPRLSDLTSLR
jgi:hypothetical protein